MAQSLAGWLALAAFVDVVMAHLPADAAQEARAATALERAAQIATLGRSRSR